MLRRPQNQPENRALPRAVLPHERHLRATAHREAHFVEDRLFLAMIKRHSVKTDNNVAGEIGGVRGIAVALACF